MKKIAENRKHRYIFSILGIFSGFVNGFFGSGGGMIAIESMERSGLESRRAHASSILFILPLSIMSAAVYFLKSRLSFVPEHRILLGGAAVGGFVGAKFLGKLSSTWIDRIFTILMILSGFRMVCT